MSKKHKIEPRDLYASLMDEVNARLEVIRLVMSGLPPMNPMLAEEIGYFELRMTLEVIACACLVCHGEITGGEAIERLSKEWSADTIIKRLGNLHDNFFPQPRIFEISATNVHLAEKNTPTLTKAEFLRLYAKSHARTHRGALRTIAERPPYTEVNLKPIIDAESKIRELLDNHLIQSPDRRRNFLVMMRAAQTGGKPLVAYASAPTEDQK